MGGGGGCVVTSRYVTLTGMLWEYGGSNVSPSTLVRDMLPGVL